MGRRPQLSARTGPTYQLAEFMNRHWDTRVSRTNEDVATELGLRAANMISMWRTGKTRVALQWVPDIARLMGVDQSHLLLLWHEQYWGERDDADEVLADFADRLLTEHEVALIRTVRSARGGRDGAFSEATLRAVAATIAAESAHGAGP